MGALGKMEMEKVPQAGYRIEGLWISGLQRKLTAGNLAFPFKVLLSLRKSRRILKEFKPHIAVGVGGFASGPLLYAAAKMNIPTLIQEQNSYPGITNKILARRVRKICVAYDHMERFFPEEKIVFTGNPVRKDLMDISGKREAALKFFGLNANEKVLLVIGGSLGARTLNASLYQNIGALIDNKVQTIWQTGRIYHQEFKDKMAKYGSERVKLVEFLKEMDLAYAAADAVISRAGALSVSELCLAGKPVIFVPSPNVAEDHQTKNALSLANQRAALIVKDADARTELVPEAIRLLNDEPKRRELETNIRKLARPNATDNIVNEIIDLIGE